MQSLKKKFQLTWIGIEPGGHCYRYTHCIPQLKKVIVGEASGRGGMQDFI